MKAVEELQRLEIEECSECKCAVGDDWEYKEFSNKTIIVCPQCKSELALEEEIEFEIYFNDLKEEVQKELLKTVSAGFPEDMNWDTLPVDTLYFEFEKINREKGGKK